MLELSNPQASPGRYGFVTMIKSRVAQWLRAEILVSSCTSDSCGVPGAEGANQGCQVHGVSSDTLVRLASGLDGAVLTS